MPRVDPIEPDMLAELTNAAVAGAELLGSRGDDPPEAIVATVNGHVERVRGKDPAPSRADMINLGVVLGDQYVRAFGWQWANLVYPDGDEAFAVVNVDHSYGNQPMNWIYSIVVDGNELNLLLNFNMIAAGDLPTGTPGDPTMVH